MGENNERKKALEVAMAQIEKQFGKGSVMKLGEYKAMEIEAIPTGALGLEHYILLLKHKKWEEKQLL